MFSLGDPIQLITILIQHGTEIRTQFMICERFRMLLPCLRIKVKKPPISSRAIQEETGWINILLKNVTFETEEKSYK